MSLKLKWVLGISGSLVVGALGSGLWSLIFEPMFRRGSRTLLSLITFGIDAIRDHTYASMAGGFGEFPSLTLLQLAAAILLLLGPAVFFLNFLVTRIYRQRVAEVTRDPSKEATRAKWLTWGERTSTVVSVVCGMVFFVQVQLTSYAHRAIVMFNRGIAICRPHISPQQEKELLAKFAVIKSRADYVAVFDTVKGIARTNSVNIDFEPW